MLMIDYILSGREHGAASRVSRGPRGHCATTAWPRRRPDQACPPPFRTSLAAHTLQFHGRSALQTAAAQGQTACVEALVRTEKMRLLLDACEGEPDGRTALLLAVVGGHIATVAALLGFGASPERRDRGGMCALHLALSHQRPEVARAIVASGRANINACDATQSTPLMLAARMGSMDMVALLLRNGANVKLIDHDGHTAFELAEAHQQRECAQMLEAAAAIPAPFIRQASQAIVDTLDVPRAEDATADSPRLGAAQLDSTAAIPSAPATELLQVQVREQQAQLESMAQTREREREESTAQLRAAEAKNASLQHQLDESRRDVARLMEQIELAQSDQLPKIEADAIAETIQRQQIEQLRAQLASLDQQLVTERLQHKHERAALTEALQSARDGAQLQASQQAVAQANGRADLLLTELHAARAELAATQRHLSELLKKQSVLEQADDAALKVQRLESRLALEVEVHQDTQGKLAQALEQLSDLSRGNVWKHGMNIPSTHAAGCGST